MAHLPQLFWTRSWVHMNKNHSRRFGIINMIFIFRLKMVYCVYTQYIFMLTKIWKYIPIKPPDLVLWLSLISSNNPCLEHIFMVPKVFEPRKFYCIVRYTKLSVKDLLKLLVHIKSSVLIFFSRMLAKSFCTAKDLHIFQQKIAVCLRIFENLDLVK